MGIKNILVKGTSDKPIVTDVYYQSNQQPKTIVIFCHGYKGYKDWGAWNLMAQVFEKKNMFFVKFNFSHNGGTPENPIDFSDLKAFGKNTFSQELEDVSSVIDWILQAKEFKLEVNPEKIVLIGHSRGGAIAMLHAAKDIRVKKIITWAAVSDFEKRFPRGVKLLWWRIRGVAYIKNSRTKQKLPHYFSFYTDFKKNYQNLHVQSALKKLKAKHLIIHGTNDEVVKLEEAKQIHLWNPESELYVIKEMNHALGNLQPWTKSVLPHDLEKVIDKTLLFIDDKA